MPYKMFNKYFYILYGNAVLTKVESENNGGFLILSFGCKKLYFVFQLCISLAAILSWNGVILLPISTLLVLNVPGFKTIT